MLGGSARFVRRSWSDMLADSVLDLVWRVCSPYRCSSKWGWSEWRVGMVLLRVAICLDYEQFVGFVCFPGI